MIPIRQKPHGLILILLSAVIFIPVMSLMELIRYTDGWPAVRVQFMLSTVAFCLFIGPITALFLFLIRRKHLHPILRTLIVISPALFFLILQIRYSLASSKDRFSEMMDCELPAHATDFKAWHFGGAFIDELDMYHFRATPENIDRLLASRAYSLDKSTSRIMSDPQFQRSYNELPVLNISPPEGWPKPREWPGLQVYRFKKENWFYHIMVDGDKSEVFVVAGCY